METNVNVRGYCMMEKCLLTWGKAKLASIDVVYEQGVTNTIVRDIYIYII